MTVLLHILTFGMTITGILYTIAVLTVIWSLRKVRSGRSPVMKPVSVVIAARNERHTIGNCLAALAVQDYFPDKFEVIIADDRSGDGTSEVIERFRPVFKKLIHIKIKEVEKGISPKKNALISAIDSAKGDIILQTDADCIPPPGWISGMVRRFEDNVGMVTGIAPYCKEPGILNSFIRHEYLWNAALSAASIASGHGSHASGRNLAFKKNTFFACEGYGSHKKVLSGDDTLLMQRFCKNNPSSVVTMPDRSTHVFTRAPQTFTGLIRQRIRHMSTGKYFDPFLILPGVFIYGFHILLVSALIMSAASLSAMILFLSGFLWKCVWDALAVLRTKTVLKLDAEWRSYIVNEFFLTLYMAGIPLCGLIFPVKWKEK